MESKTEAIKSILNALVSNTRKRSDRLSTEIILEGIEEENRKSDFIRDQLKVNREALSMMQDGNSEMRSAMQPNLNIASTETDRIYLEQSLIKTTLFINLLNHKIAALPTEASETKQQLERIRSTADDIITYTKKRLERN